MQDRTSKENIKPESKNHHPGKENMLIRDQEEVNKEN